VLVRCISIWLKLALVVALALLFSCFTHAHCWRYCSRGLVHRGIVRAALRNLPVEVMSPAMGALHAHGCPTCCRI